MLNMVSVHVHCYMYVTDMMGCAVQEEAETEGLAMSSQFGPTN